MAQASPKPLMLRCEDAVAQNRSFTASVNGAQTTIDVDTAKQLLAYRSKLSRPAREGFDTLSTSNQLQLAATLPLFTPEQ